MSIVYDETQKTFTLHTKNTTYQMQVDKYGFLLHLYYGKHAEGCMDYLLTYYDRGFQEIRMTPEMTRHTRWILCRRNFLLWERRLPYAGVHYQEYGPDLLQ